MILVKETTSFHILKEFKPHVQNLGEMVGRPRFLFYHMAGLEFFNDD